jgi:hypothetical protein
VTAKPDQPASVLDSYARTPPPRARLTQLDRPCQLAGSPTRERGVIPLAGGPVTAIKKPTRLGGPAVSRETWARPDHNGSSETQWAARAPADCGSPGWPGYFVSSGRSILLWLIGEDRRVVRQAVVGGRASRDPRGQSQAKVLEPSSPVSRETERIQVALTAWAGLGAGLG